MLQYGLPPSLRLLSLINTSKDLYHPSSVSDRPIEKKRKVGPRANESSSKIGFRSNYANDGSRPSSIITASASDKGEEKGKFRKSRT